MPKDPQGRDLTPQGLPTGWSENEILNPRQPATSPGIGLKGWLGVAGFAVVGMVVLIIILHGPASRSGVTDASDDPMAAVRRYVAAAFGPASSGLAGVTCRSPHLDEIDALRTDLGEREQRFAVTITVTVDGLTESVRGDTATVSGDLSVRSVASGTGQSAQLVERYQFTVVRETAWRVCGAHRTA